MKTLTSVLFSIVNLNVFALFFCLVFTNHCSAQTAKGKRIDSLLAIIKLAEDDTGKVALLYTLAKLYPDYDPNKGAVISKQALELAQKLNWDEGMVISYIAMGLNQDSKTDYPNAIKSFELANEISNEINNKRLSGVATKYTGVTYFDQNRYPEALQYFFEALQIEEDLHNRKEIFIILEFIGRVYEAQKNYDKALEYYKISYDSALVAGEINAKGKNLVNIGQIYLVINKNTEALACFKESLAIFKGLKDEGGIGISLADISIIYLQFHQYNEALQKAFEALAIYTRYADRQNIASMYEGVGKIYLSIASDTSATVLPDSLLGKKENIRKAFYYLNKSIELCKSLSSLEGMYITYNDLSSAYELNGDYKASLNAFKSYISIRDSIFSTENNIKIANLEISREISIKDHQLKIEKLRSQKRRNENIFFISSIILLLLVTFIFYRNFRKQIGLNETISKLVSEQEKIIASRTQSLTEVNKKLVDLVQFNVHTVREPITRILGLMLLKKYVSVQEFTDICLPMLEQSVNDLDNSLKQVVKTVEETTK